MPTSMLHTLPYVVHCINLAEPSTILDCGIGFGKLAFVLREQSLGGYLSVEQKATPKAIRACWDQTIEGIEGFPPVISSLQDALYDKIYRSRIEDVMATLSVYDVICMGDVIEHFEQDTGIRVFRKLYSVTRKMLIVVTPAYGNWEQGAAYGNELEIHRSFWGRRIFRKLGEECPYLLQFVVAGQFPAKRIVIVCRDKRLYRRVGGYYGCGVRRFVRGLYQRLPCREWLRKGRLYSWYKDRG